MTVRLGRNERVVGKHSDGMRGLMKLESLLMFNQI
jgi:hypothetical protein